jgi:hypothetical protein
MAALHRAAFPDAAWDAAAFAGLGTRWCWQGPCNRARPTGPAPVRRPRPPTRRRTGAGLQKTVDRPSMLGGNPQGFDSMNIPSLA